MIKVLDKENCCGCSACYNVCPKQCIKMKSDEEGFLYPIVDELNCINCGLCEAKCPIVNKNIQKNEIVSYVGINKCDSERAISTSGGIVGAINEYVIEKLNGVAYGVIYDSGFMPVHARITTKKDALLFCGSKYAQSYVGDTFNLVKNDLESGKNVVFTGTPCQVAGLKSFLGREYTGLITIDMVCRSIPSPKLWKKYLEWQENRYKSQIDRVNCRAKTYGYHNGTLTIQFKNGKRYTGSNRVDLYMKAFHNDICSRPSCYKCNFKDIERSSDFTIFDSWNANYVTDGLYSDDNKGCSNIICRSKKAFDLINSIDNIELYNASMTKMFEYSGGMESKSISYNEKRRFFYKDLENIGFEKTIISRIEITIVDYVIEKIKPLYFNVLRRGRK